MKTSVVLATYNGAAYLREQINSILSQTSPPDEIIITDDLSTDSSLFIIEEVLKNSYIPFKIVSNNGIRGYGFNFMNGINYATGDIIFLSDQDDVWNNDKIQKCLDLMKEHPKIYVLVHDAKIVTKENLPTGITIFENAKRLGIPIQNLHHGFCMAIRRDLLRAALPAPQIANFAHDSWINILISCGDHKILYSTVLANYRRHGTNASLEQINEFLKYKFINFQIIKYWYIKTFKSSKARTIKIKTHKDMLESAIERIEVFPEILLTDANSTDKLSNLKMELIRLDIRLSFRKRFVLERVSMRDYFQFYFSNPTCFISDLLF
jgi:glycosyltransferase involved in cell wall biosynthesis